MYYTVYKTTNILNGKIYIGKHKIKDLSKDDGYRGSGVSISKDIEEFGAHNFTREILFIYETEQEALDKEKELVTVEFCQRIDTYNSHRGGTGSWGKCNKSGKNLYGYNGYTPNVKDNFAKALETRRRMKIDDPEAYEKMCRNNSIAIKRTWEENGHPWDGRNHKEETKILIGEKAKIHQLGTGNSQYGTMWITNGISNKKILKDSAEIPPGWRKGRVM